MGILEFQMQAALKVAEGLARGLSVEAGCEYVHLIALDSLALSSVKTHYSGILGVFPNIMVNMHGASGDGKSIPLWFDTQVFFSHLLIETH